MIAPNTLTGPAAQSPPRDACTVREDGTRRAGDSAPRLNLFHAAAAVAGMVAYASIPLAIYGLIKLLWRTAK